MRDIFTSVAGAGSLSPQVEKQHLLDAVDAIKGVARAMARNQGRELGEVTRHTFQRFSLALQKGNAAILANRVTPVTRLTWMG